MNTDKRKLGLAGPKHRQRNKLIEIKDENDKLVKLYRLTDSEQRLLEVLKDPEVVKLTVSGICKRAKIARNTYYNAFGKDEFMKAVRATTQRVLLSSLLPVAHVHRSEAIKWKDHHAARLVYEALGILDKSEKKLTQQININLGFPRPAPVVEDDGKTINVGYAEVIPNESKS